MTSTVTHVHAAAHEAGTPADTPPLRLHVDFTRCDGHGACIDLLPELLTEDPWGYPVARQTQPMRRGVDVPPALQQEARTATHLCPALALRLLR